MSRVGIATQAQEGRHVQFVNTLRASHKNKYSRMYRWSDGGAGTRHHRSTRVGGKGK